MANTPNPGRLIAHVDMDAFYASIEVIDDPTLEGKPVVVGGPPEKRGVVAAASYAAREFGIHSAMPMGQAVRKCPHLIRISPRMARYRDESIRLMGILGTFSPTVEPLALDEAFLDLSGMERSIGSARELGQQIRAKIKAETGLTASVGMAPNKFVAKLASDFDKPDGLTLVEPSEAVSFVQNLPIKKIWGVGAKTAAKLDRIGIRDVAALSKSEPSLLKRHFGVLGLRLHELAWARDDRPVVAHSETKSVSHEITFAKNQKSTALLKGVLTGLCEQTARRLRHGNLVGKTVTLKIRFSDFATVTRQDTVGHPTEDAGEIYEIASRLLELEREVDERSVRLLGVGVTSLLRKSQLNLELFGPEQLQQDTPSLDVDQGDSKRDRLNQTLDRLEDRFGPQTTQRARAHLATGESED